MKKQQGFTAIELIFVIVTLLGGFGWCANLYKITTHMGSISDAGFDMVLRVIGIFIFPVGMVMGYL